MKMGSSFRTKRPGLCRAVMSPVAFFPVDLADISAL